MIDPLAEFDWASLYARYDRKCLGFHAHSPHLALYGADRPVTDRNLYYRLIGHDGIAPRTTDPLGWYEALLYWKLYSQPAATSNLRKWMAPGSTSRRSAESSLPRLLASLPKTLARSVDVVVDALKDLSNFGLPGMSTQCAIPVRSTFLHFLYPTIVPIFDKMVLKAVGVNVKDANHDYNVLREYLPHSWKLADLYAARATAQCKDEQPIRLIDMALWVNRGEPGADGVAPSTSQSAVKRVSAGRLSNHKMFERALVGYQGKELATAQIRKIVQSAFPDFSIGSVLPNDHAEGNKSPCSCAGTSRRIFDRVDRALFRVR